MTQYEGITYLVGRPFSTGEREYTTGDECAEAETFKYVDSLVSTGFLYRVASDKDYDRLPVHIFHAVQTRQEVLDQLAAGGALVEDTAAPHVVDDADVPKRRSRKAAADN
jgi:hypothetical protein